MNLCWLRFHGFLSICDAVWTVAVLQSLVVRGDRVLERRVRQTHQRDLRLLQDAPLPV